VFGIDQPAGLRDGMDHQAWVLAGGGLRSVCSAQALGRGRLAAAVGGLRWILSSAKILKGVTKIRREYRAIEIL